MKKTKCKLLLLLFVFCSFNCISQTRLKKWYLSPYQVDLSSTINPPSVTNIPGAINSAQEWFNGIYDPDNLNGPPIFYIAGIGSVAPQAELFNKNSSSFGFLPTTPEKTNEIAIVPYPDNNGCTKNKYYIFWSSSGSSGVELVCNTVDMNGNGGLGSLLNGSTIVAHPYSDFGGIAVGGKHNINGDRYLYFCTGNAYSADGRKIDKITISTTGLTQQNIFTDHANFYDFETSELDLSPDGSMLAFASDYNIGGGPYPPRYYIIGLNGNGDYNNIIRTFNVGTDNSPGGRGVEFYDFSARPVSLMVGAGSDGVFSIDPTNPSVGQYQIPNTFTYGFSQLERGYNGYIYAGSSTNIAAIDVSLINPILKPSFDIPLAPTYVSFPGIFYTLLDQIDNEDYDLSVTPYKPFDLYIKDNYTPGHNDIGIEPNPDNGPMWISGDIWSRQTPTQGGGVDETLEWTSDPTVYSYIFVRVRNESCVDYAGGDNVYLNWTKGSTTMLWPNDWEDATASTMNCGGNNLLLGGNVHPDDHLPIPPILAGASAVLMFRWQPPVNPDDFLPCFPGTEYSHYCLIARIVAPVVDPTGSVGAYVYDNTKNENNWAWKNIAVMNVIPGIVHNQDCYSQDEQQQGGVVAVCNPYDNDMAYDLEFKVDEQNQGIPIFEQAEITATLDETTWQKWVGGGSSGVNIRISREECRQIQITGSPASLNNLTYAPQEKTLISLSFNFISEKVDATPVFDYHLIQRKSESHSMIGGELYRIQKPDRLLFGADAGVDKTIAPEESTLLTAQSIGEPAFYNWYDEGGTLIYSGTDFNANPEITTKYKLQVIAESDGFTSYDEVIVHVKDYQIKSINPNPATNNLTVEYEANQASTSYFSVCPFNSNSSNNYVIDPTLHSTTLNISGLQTGNYYLRLIANGEVKDEMTFVVVQ